MISQRAVRQFLNRPMRSYDWYKDLTKRELDERMERLPVRPPIWNKLFKVQKACFLVGAKRRRFLFLLDTGVGKTLLSISLVRYFKRKGSVNHVLVLVPNRSNIDEWEFQLQEHSPNSSYQMLRGSTRQKWERFRDKPTLFYVATYGGLSRMVCKLEARKKGKGKRLVPDRKLVQELMSRIDCLILDESTFAKNKHKLPFRICRQLAKNSKATFGLAAVPSGRDQEDLWAQFFIVDGGETLGETLGLFRAAYFTEKQNYWGGLEYTLKKSSEKLLARRVLNRSITYEVDEADLPPTRRVEIMVKFPLETLEYYEKAKQQFLAARGNYQEQKNAFMLMRQISSGFIGYKDDETGTRAQFAFDEQPKRDKLIEKIESIQPHHKIVVAHEFNFTGASLGFHMAESGIGNVRLWGGTKDTKQVREQFRDDPACRVLLLQNKSGGYGLNLQLARYLFFYESPLGFINRRQVERRVVRQGNDARVVFVYDLLMQGSYDRRIIESQDEGQKFFESIFRRGK